MLSGPDWLFDTPGDIQIKTDPATGSFEASMYLPLPQQVQYRIVPPKERKLAGGILLRKKRLRKKHEKDRLSRKVLVRNSPGSSYWVDIAELEQYRRDLEYLFVLDATEIRELESGETQMLLKVHPPETTADADGWYRVHCHTLGNTTVTTHKGPENAQV